MDCVQRIPQENCTRETLTAFQILHISILQNTFNSKIIDLGSVVYSKFGKIKITQTNILTTQLSLTHTLSLTHRQTLCEFNSLFKFCQPTTHIQRQALKKFFSLNNSVQISVS
eukprot:sb/3476987/